MGIKERLIEYLKIKNIKKVHFEKSINVSNGYVNNIVKNIPYEKLSIIKELYPDLNIDWLQFGEGEMIKMQGKSLDSNYAKVDNQWQMVQEESEHYNVTPIDNGNYMIVEYADLRVSAGPLGTKNLNALPKNKTRLVPKEYDRGEYMVLRFTGSNPVLHLKFCCFRSLSLCVWGLCRSYGIYKVSNSTPLFFNKKTANSWR